LRPSRAPRPLRRAAAVSGAMSSFLLPPLGTAADKAPVAAVADAPHTVGGRALDIKHEPGARRGHVVKRHGGVDQALSRVRFEVALLYSWALWTFPSANCERISVNGSSGRGRVMRWSSPTGVRP